MSLCCESKTSVASKRRGAFSLVEVLAVVTILGVLAAIVITRFVTPTKESKRNSCYVNKGELELQAQLWYRNNGTWPSANLSDIGSDPTYCPDGVPTCPVDGSPYRFDPATQRIIGHTH